MHINKKNQTIFKQAQKSIEKIIADGFFELIFSEIGYLETVYSNDLAYDTIVDESDRM